MEGEWRANQRSISFTSGTVKLQNFALLDSLSWMCWTSKPRPVWFIKQGQTSSPPVITQRMLKHSGTVLVLHPLHPVLVHAKGTGIYGFAHYLHTVRIFSHRRYEYGGRVLGYATKPQVKYNAVCTNLKLHNLDKYIQSGNYCIIKITTNYVINFICIKKSCMAVL